MIGKKELSEVLSLSCVENYFLPWLNQYYDIRNLYGKDFLSVQEILNDFNNGVLYENYYGIKRIQDVAESYGITKHQFYQANFDELLKLIQNDNLILIRVNHNFFKTYKRRAWREDHYIMIDKELNWLNQYPLSDGKFSLEELKEVYDGAVCIYQINNLNIKFNDNLSLKLINQDFTNIKIPYAITSLEGAVGVLRITRKRLKEYYHNILVIQEILNEEITYLDKLYFQIRLIELKGLGDKCLEDLIEPIIKYEKRIREALENEENRT